MLPLALALAGCSGGGDTGGAAPDVDEWVPAISAIDRVACVADGPMGEAWEMALTVADPQGDDTVAAAAVSVRTQAGGELGRYTFACADGACAGSFRADYDAVTCALDGTIAFVFTVTDENGNVSAARTQETW